MIKEATTAAVDPKVRKEPNAIFCLVFMFHSPSLFTYVWNGIEFFPELTFTGLSLMLLIGIRTECSRDTIKRRL